MKRNMILASLVLSLVLTATASAKEAITVNIRGMVCAFCAQGITKKFKGIAAVDEVKVNLDDKTVKLTTKDKETISDESIKEAVTESGFNLVKIERKPL